MIDPEKPYPEKVYNALKQKVNGFDLSPEDFYTKLNDPAYQTNVYNALKTKVQGFDMPETEFYDRLKKKDQTDSVPSSIAAPERPKISTPPTFEGENLVPGTPQPLVDGDLPSGLTEEQDKQKSLESLRQDWDKITGGDHRPIEDLANSLPIDLKEKTFEQVRQEHDQQKRAEQGAKDYITGAEDKEVNPFVTFGKSVWNTLAYQLPSALAGTVAATGQSSMDHPSAEAMFPDFSKPKGAPGHRSQEQITNDTRSNMIDWAVKHGAKGEEITKDLVGTMDKIKDPIDALNWFSYALGQAAGQIPASVVSGGATSIGQEVGSIYLDGVKKIAQDNKLTIQQVIDQKLDHPAIAVAFGTASGLLDYVGAKSVLKVPKETLLKSLRRRALDLVKTGGTEAGTEYSQTWIEQIGKGQAAGNDLGNSWEEANTNESARERLESAAQGFVGGAGAHVVSTMSTKPQENASNIESTAPVGEQPLGTQSTGGVGSEGVGPSQQGTETTGTSEPESKVPATEEKAQVTEEAPKYPNGASTVSTPSGNPKLAALANRYSELTGTAINRKTARTIVERVGKKYAESPEHVKAIESRFRSFVTDEGKFNAIRAHEAFEKSPEWIKSTYDLTDEEFEEIKNDLNEKAKKQGTAVQESTESESTKGNGVTSESSGQTSQEEGHPEEEEPDWVTGEPMSRMAHAQFTGHRADGRTAKQVDVASRKIGRRALDAINRRLLAKFPSIKGVITNKEKVIQAWNDYLTHGGGIFMSFANQNNKLTTEMQTKLDKAEKLENDKISPYEIWKRTGWFKYKDGQWRHELDSSKAKLLVTDKHLNETKIFTPPSNESAVTGLDKFSAPLSKVIQFDELFSIDPEAKNISVRFVHGVKGLNGAYEPKVNSIYINLDKYGEIKTGESADAREERRKGLLSTIIHELTHRLQHTGGLSVGMSPARIIERIANETGKGITNPEVKRQAFEEYYNQASELEARKAQERIDYNDWQRTHIEPFNRKELPEFYAQNTGEELPNGFIYGDNIYINPDLARMDTPIHEFGHLWWNIVKQRFPVLYAAGQRLVKNSAYHKEVLDNPAYSSLSDSMKLDEAIVQAIGEKGALYANKSAWNKFWSDLWSKIKQVLGIKANIDLGKMSLNDLVSMAGRELLTPGEIGHLSSLHMPETATMRLKEFKLPKDAWDDWNQRVQLETIVNNPKSPEWEKAIKSAASERASAFMRGVQDNTRPMLEIQHDIVNDFIAKQKEVIDKDKSLDKKQKNQAKSALDKNRHAISEKLIGDAKDVHGLMDLMSGKAEAEIKRMHNWLYGKATTEKGYGGVMEFLTKDTDLRGRERVDQDSFAARVQKEGLTLLDVGFYGYVMHAEERNAHKSKISEGETKHGSGMTDEEAKFFKEEIKKRGKEEVLEKFFREAHDKLVQEPLSFRLQEGIINEKDYHVLKNFYGQHYVPLNVEEFASKSGSTGGLSTGLWGTGIKKAQGSDQYRYWQRTNPMVQLIKNYEKTIADIETNKVYKSLLKLAKESPNEKVWDIIRPKVVVTPEVNPDTGDIDYKVEKFNSAAEERAMMTESVRVRVNGKQVFVHLKDPELRSMFLDKKANKPSNRFLVDMIRTVNNIQTYQRLTYIGLNIDFPFSNIQRDFQDALVNLQQHEIPGISRKILTDVPQAMVAIMKEELGKSSDPNISMMRHYMEEMEAQGGMISWLDMGGTKEIRADVEKEIHRFQDLQKKFKPGEMLLTPTRKLMRAVVVYNKMMEGAIRLSTYANLREAGVSEHKAAKVSKNVTVNFNKKGSWGNFINLLYLFGNAGIQGVTMFTTSVIKSRKVKAMVLGAILAQIAMRTLLDNLADDDDEIKKLLNENDHNKNWIFVWPHSKGKLITIPVSYNMKPYKAIADGLYDLKKGTKDVSEASLYILKNAINSLVPMTESHLYPTLTVPIVEPIQNESMFSGRMIAPEKKTIGQRDSELYWPRTSKPFVNLAKGMSNAIEGNDDILEVSPAVMEYEFDYLMGGMKSYYKLGENAIDVANGMPTDWNKIPVLRRNVLDLSTQDWRGTTKMREYFGAFQKKRITQDQFDTYLQLRKELVESGAINYKKYSPKLIIRLQFKDFNNPLYVDPKYTPKSKESEDDLY